MISIQKLYKSFGKNEVLKGIDLDFEGSGVSSVLGPNGSGKTTLIKCILNMVIPDSGEIRFNDVSIFKHWNYRNQIGYLPQIARFPENLSVNELFNMIIEIRNAKPNPSLLDRLISDFELEPFLDKRISNLSGGTRQKANIVQAFMYDSPVLLLDEPTAGLDPISRIQLKSLIRNEAAKEKTILITSHVMNFVEEMSDELVFLLEGKVYFRGHPEELKKQFNEPKLEEAIAKILQGQSAISKEEMV